MEDGTRDIISHLKNTEHGVIGPVLGLGKIEINPRTGLRELDYSLYYYQCSYSTILKCMILGNNNDWIWARAKQINNLK